MPKKPSSSGFYYFMIEYKDSQEAHGKHYQGGLQEISNILSAQWNAMKPEDKKKYNDMAKKIRGPEKYNSLGVSLSSIEKQQKEGAALLEAEEKEVTDTVRHPQGVAGLVEVKFHIIETNYYCKLSNGHFVTSEIAVVEFSLAHGVTNVYHTLLDVGKIPVGYAREAQEQSQATGVPLPPLQEGEEDPIRVLAHIVQLLGGPNEPPPPLYARPAHLLQTRDYLLQLTQVANEEPNMFRVFSLPRLFYHLRNAVQKGSLPQMSMAETYLQKDNFSHCTGMGCEIHEEGEKYPECAKARAVRAAYLICDYCCKLAGVELRAGQHVPRQAQTQPLQFETVDCGRSRTGSSQASSVYSQAPSSPRPGPSPFPGASQAPASPGPSSSGQALGSPTRTAPVKEQWPTMGGGMTAAAPTMSAWGPSRTPAGPPAAPRPGDQPPLGPGHLAGRGRGQSADVDLQWPSIGRGSRRR